MRLYIRIVDKLNEGIGTLVSFLMIPLVLIASYEVMMRYIFNRPTIWAWDLNIQIFAAIIMLAGGYTLLKGDHVCVDALVHNMNPRNRAIMNLLTPIFIFIGCGVLMVWGWDMAWMSFQMRETMSTVWAPPYYIMKMLVPAGALLLILQGLSEFFKNLIIIFSKDEKE